MKLSFFLLLYMLILFIYLFTYSSEITIKSLETLKDHNLNSFHMWKKSL